MPSDKKGGADGFKDRLVSPSSEFGLNTAGCLAPNGGGCGAFLVAYMFFSHLFSLNMTLYSHLYLYLPLYLFGACEVWVLVVVAPDGSSGAFLVIDWPQVWSALGATFMAPMTTST